MAQTQRFITGIDVFDTYLGQRGQISEMNLTSAAVPPLAPFYSGPYFVVDYANGVRQTYTTAGRRVEQAGSLVVPGITLLTQNEYTSLISAGYPTS